MTFIEYSATAGYIFFSSSHETFTKLEHILAHKTNLKNFERIEIIQSILSDHNGIEIEINNRKIAGEDPNMLRIKEHRNTHLEQSSTQRIVITAPFVCLVKGLPWREKLCSVVRFKEENIRGLDEIPLLFLRIVRILSYPIAEAVLDHKCNQSSLLWILYL